MTRHFICIIGTDGSGKTTLAEAVAEALCQRGKLARRVWLGAESILMKPVRGLLKLLWARNPKGRTADNNRREGAASQRVNYAAEIVRKSSFAARHRVAVQLYLALVRADYWLQLTLKRWRHRKMDVVLADRYLFDVVVNLGLTLGWSPSDVVREIQRWLGWAELPAIRVFLRVPADIALTRKNDVYDIDYLRLRLDYYDAIAKAFGFDVRDGTLPIEVNRDWLLSEIGANAKRPYVLYVHANNSDIGGADKVLALMARHMRDYGRPAGGFRVAVVLRLETAILETHGQAGVPVILSNFVRPQISYGFRGLLRFLLAVPGSLWFFWRLNGREHPDIVHVNDLYDFLPVFAAWLRGIPVIWHIRMIVTREGMRRVFTRLIAQFSRFSVSVSKAVRDHYFPGATDESGAIAIHDLGNAALIADSRDPSTTARRPLELPSHGRLVLMVGRIEPWKGQQVFIKAVQTLPAALRRQHVFALVGGKVDGKEDYFEEICAVAEETGILLLGNRDDIPELLWAADISVHASVSPDPFPGVVIESLLAGAATIAARGGGTIEMIDDGEHGFLTAPGDVVTLASRLEALLTAPSPPRTRFGHAARQRGLSLVNAEEIDQALATVYARVYAEIRIEKNLYHDQ